MSFNGLFTLERDPLHPLNQIGMNENATKGYNLPLYFITKSRQE
jgi:hypothetical protein